MKFKVYPYDVLPHSSRGRSDVTATPPATTTQATKDNIDNIEMLLKRIARYYKPENAIAFDYYIKDVINKSSTEYWTIFSVGAGYRTAIVREIGIFAQDPSVFTFCTFTFCVNRSPISSFILSGLNYGFANLYSYESPNDLYINIPANANFQIKITNRSATTNFTIAVRATGWFEP